jgi:Mor family transcriptional regulator
VTCGLGPYGAQDSSSLERLGNFCFLSLDQATDRILRLLHFNSAQQYTPKPIGTSRKTDRNRAIVERYKAGELAVDLAKEYGISDKRLYQILKGRRK